MFSHYFSFIPLVLVLFVWGTFVTLCNQYLTLVSANKLPLRWKIGLIHCVSKVWFLCFVSTWKFKPVWVQSNLQFLIKKNHFHIGSYVKTIKCDGGHLRYWSTLWKKKQKKPPHNCIAHLSLVSNGLVV